MGWDDRRVGVEYDGVQHWTDPRPRPRIAAPSRRASPAGRRRRRRGSARRRRRTAICASVSGRRDQSLNVSLCVSVTPSHALDEAVVGHRDAVADEPRGELGVEHAGRAHAVAGREQQQIARRRVHHELHRRIADQLGDRADVDVLERIEHGEPLRPSPAAADTARGCRCAPTRTRCRARAGPRCARRPRRPRRRPDPADARSQSPHLAPSTRRARGNPRRAEPAGSSTRIPGRDEHGLG